MLGHAGVFIIDSLMPLNLFSDNSRLASWRDHLLKRDSVIISVVDNFEALFIDYIKDTQAYISKQIS